MSIRHLPLAGAAEIQLKRHDDHRGWFARWFCQDALGELNEGRPIQQINSSFTKTRGTVRGLHLQFAPKMEDKIVRCLRGSMFDVIVDLRDASPTKGQWCSVILDAEKQNLLYVPKGFAHGFQTLEPDTQILYLHTEFHSPGSEGGYRHDSPSLDIDWPLPPVDLSERDKNLPLWEHHLPGIDL
jgi:dTDP-4-dehydrorhamnose 3,5-epimerase